MTRYVLTVALAAAAAMAHAQGPASSAKKPPARAASPAATQTAPPAAQIDPGAALAPGEAVITVRGLCEGAASKTAGACTTVITKERFEKLLGVVNPGNQAIPAAMRRNLAQSYVELLAFAQAATDAGVENDPKFQESMRLARLQKLAEFHRRSLEEKSRNASSEEIQAYYSKNSSRYDEVVLSRIFVPRTNPAAKEKEAWEKKAGEAIEGIRARAAKGEDMDHLQKEVYSTLGLTTPPPPSSLGARRRGLMLPQEEEVVFAMKAGEVSRVITEQNAYIIYKLQSRESIPLDRVRDEISREIFRQKLEAQTKAITASVHSDLNDRYFGPPPPPPAPPAARPPAAPVKPPARPVAHD